MAADSASRTVAQQVSGETEKSRAEFLRAKRQELYSRVIADETELSQLENERLEEAIRYAYSEAKPAPPRSDDFFKLLDQKRMSLERDSYVIDILASDGVRDAYSNLIVSRRGHHEGLYRLYICSIVPGSCDFDKKKKDYLEQEAGYWHARGQLIRAARHDMGSE